MRKAYRPFVDLVFKNKFWFTGHTRKLTDKEAEPLLKAGKIYEYIARPRRFVELHEPDGTIKK